MAYREVPRMEIGEVIRLWLAGHSRRQIAAGTGLSRDTVAKYPYLRRGRLWRRRCRSRRALPRRGRFPARSS